MEAQKGSHAKYVNDTNPARIVVVPIHDTVARGTLKSILAQAELSLEEFLKL
jgi:predicted RNA binding protein YcfA (HicA-like mRNA interferase family)